MDAITEVMNNFYRQHYEAAVELLAETQADLDRQLERLERQSARIHHQRNEIAVAHRVIDQCEATIDAYRSVFQRIFATEGEDVREAVELIIRAVHQEEGMMEDVIEMIESYETEYGSDTTVDWWVETE